MLSDNVVVLTRDEYRDRLAAEFRRGVSSALENRATLFERAALRDHDTGVTFSSNGSARVHVATWLGGDFGDMVELRWMNEANPGVWYRAPFSPARAKIIAHDLVRKATLREEDHYGGPKKIDPIPEQMRQGPIGTELPR